MADADPPPRPVPPPVRAAARLAWRLGGGIEAAPRDIPEETAIAFSYEGASYAVMMATPADLEDFALGLSLNEGIVTSAAEIESLEVAPVAAGIVLRMTLAGSRKDAFWGRRRRLAGPSGCGLCGIESIEDALRASPMVTGDHLRLPARAVLAAVRDIQARQALGRRTRALHAAAFWHPDRGCIAVREDVGRHNALDKLAGALARQGIAGGSGAVVLTSRVSVELVQKAAMMGVPMMIAVSAPTALAVRTAEAAGITLVAVARQDGFEIFTHPQRLLLPGSRRKRDAVNPEKLVYMANQIGGFFTAQGEDAPARIADHLAKFWDPRMRQALIRHADAGGAGLTPAVAQAVTLIRGNS